MNDLAKTARQSVARPTKMTDFTALFGKYRTMIAQVAPKKGLEASRIEAMAAQVFASNPKLAECEVGSIIASVMQVSMMGFNPMPQYGEAYFIPYGGKIQLQIGYQGWIKLAYKSAIVKDLHAFCIYEGDEYEIDLGTSVKITHKIGPNYGDSSKVLYSYAVANLSTGGQEVAVLTLKEIERLRMKSPMQKGTPTGPWRDDYDQMAKAKAIKKMIKLLPREDEYRGFDFSDEAIMSIENVQNDAPFEYPEAQEGSAKVLTEDEILQQELDEKNAQEAKNG